MVKIEYINRHGYEKDQETGLHYAGARYYDSRLSIFNSTDPMWQLSPHLSPYAYCNNNPLMYIDKEGNIPWPVQPLWNNGIRCIVSGFYRNKPSDKLHKGVDIVHKPSMGANLAGGEIVATHNGKVTVSGTSKTAGNWVVIENGDIRTKYMHMKEPSKLKVGQNVEEGDFIGNIGTTGRSEGNHLHYQLEKYNSDTKKWEAINPVVGGQKHVTSKDNVELIDPQKIINERKNVNTNKTYKADEK